MPLESGNYIVDLDQTNPPAGDLRAQGDDHLRLIKKVIKNTFKNANKPFYFPASRAVTGNVTLAAADDNSIILANATAGDVTITLPPLSTQDGYKVTIKKTDASNNLVWVLRSGSDLIDGATTFSLTKQYNVAEVQGQSGGQWWRTTPTPLNGTDDMLYGQTAGVLGFQKLTLAMVPDNIFTFIKTLSTDIASQAAAEAGLVNDKFMTPLRTAQAIAALGGNGVKITKFTASGTFTKDAKTKFVHVCVQAAGGGGGGVNNTASAKAGGGTAGSYGEAIFATADVTSPVTVTLGARGNGASAGANAGGTAATTSFGSLVSCPGGKGAPGSATTTAANGGAADPPTIATTNLYARYNLGALYGQTAGMNSEMGIGADDTTANNNGGAARAGYGGGGGGAANGPSGANNRSGGNGGDAVVVVLEIF